MDIKVFSESETRAEIKTADVSSGGIGPKRMRLDTIGLGILLAITFLLPLFFVPISGLSSAFSKNALLSVSMFFTALLWFAERLKSGSFTLPKTFLSLFAFFIPLTFFISALWSPSMRVSLDGIGSEIGTALSMLVFFLLFFFATLFFQSKERVMYAYGVLAISLFIIALFQFIRLVAGADVLSLGFFNDSISNLVGKWNDLGIIFGFAVVWSLISLGLFSFRNTFKWLVYGLLAVSLFFLLIINFNAIWVVIGAFALVFFVYTFSFRNVAERSETTEAKNTSWPSFVVLTVAMFALFGSQYIGDVLAARFHVVQIEARPTFVTTASIVKETIVKNPLFGVGPNRFMNQWLLLKPEAVNDSPFWNTDFSFGIGTIVTFAVTAGLLGFLAWVLFLVSFLFIGIRTLFLFVSDKLSHYLVVSSFLLSLYLWVFAVVYTPGVVILGLAFLMTGIWVALLSSLGVFQQYRFVFSKNPQKSFLTVLVLIVCAIGSVTGIYLTSQKFIAAVLLQKSSTLFAAGEFDSAYDTVEKTARIGGNDAYYRALADIRLEQLRALLGKRDVSIDSIRSEFQSILGLAIESAKKAAEFDATNYLNWVSLARVYESVVPLGIDGAYENALNAYDEAKRYNPKSPALPLYLARLELAHGDRDASRTHISEALAMKNNYTEAIFLLSRIEADEGKITDAIASAEIASLMSPNDTGLFFHLGLLRYTNKDYIGAASALLRAATLQPNYSNAKYFLGLSYYELNKDADAISQFDEIVALNPNNTEAKQILANLKSGKRPFANGNLKESQKNQLSAPIPE